MIRFLFPLAATVAVILPAAAQVAPPASQSQPSTTIKATTQEVLLDMVFRDKKGRPVKDIRPEEVQILDNGAPQKVNSFRMVAGTPAAQQAQAAPALDPLREIRLVTLVFENLDSEGKRFFRAAVKDILDMAPEPNLYFSVFTVDQKLHCLQNFTINHKEIQDGVDKAASYNSFNQFATVSAGVKERLQRIVAAPVEIQVAPGARSGPSSAQISAAVSFQLAKMQYEMLQQADMADREVGARASLFSLQNLVRQQAKLPGRKVVLYFNPWLNIPDALLELFRDVVNTANRSNVTFYAVDPKGLVTWSQGGGGRDQVAWAANESQSQQQKGGVGGVSWGQAHQDDIISAGLRANPLLALKELAESTGGTLIAETNDWKAPLRIAMDEVRSYFVASYNPQIDVFDGKFRRIQVKVSRPDVVVHTRNGYFALPTLKGGQELLAFEMPLLNAVNATPAPADVPFRSAARRFDPRGPNIEYMLTVEVPMKGVVFQPQPEKKVAAAQASLLAVVKDQQGEIVTKFSKDFPVQVPLEKLEAYQASNIIQTFRTELAPGTYTLATAVMDRNGNKLGVKTSPITVPASTNKLSLSDLVIVRRNDVLKENELLDAFYYEGGKIVPQVTETLKGGPGQQLPFYFAVYPDATIQAAPELTMSFYLESQLLGAASAPLPKPEKSGRIAYIANIPADAFTRGKYELRASVKQGSATSEQRIQFTIE